MATIATIRADLIGSSAVFRTEMLRGQQQAAQSLGVIQTEAKRTADTLSLLGRSAAGLIGFEALRGVASSLLDAQKAVQQIHYALVSATGSAGAADDAYARVVATADKLGLSLQTSALGFSQMSAAASANGIMMSDQQALFLGLAKSATVLHLSAEQSQSAILALSQMFAKGKIQAQELQLQLGQAIPGVVPRFQQAVLAMTKGTDLAGKSFEQLLQAGDLSVQRFLPALVQALNQTGAGAEQAATGLNAQMNRLSTAWFKLKSDLSGGLFNDATTAGVKFLAENLDHLAAVASTTGGLVVARYAGLGAGKVAGAAGAAIEQQQAARAAAQAQAELAASSTAAAEAELAQTQAALQGVTATRQQALAARESAQATYQQALAQNQAAQATLAHQSTAATLSANIRAEREAMVQATAAQTNLTRSQLRYDTAVAASASLKQQQIALEARLIEAKAASAAATEAQVVAERQLAASSAAGLLTRGAAGLGNLALGLVGGPWGAAIAAIGAAGYAIYDLNEQAKAWKAGTEEEIKTLQDLREKVQAATADFGQLHAAMGLAQTLDLFKQSEDDLSKKRAELAELQAQISDVQKTMAAPGGGGPLQGLRLDELTERATALQAELPPVTSAVDALGTKLAGAMAPAIDAVRGAIDRLRSGAGLGDIVAGWSTDIDVGIKAIDTARAKVQQLQSQMQADAQSLTKAAATDGMNNVQKQQYALQQAIAQIRAQRLAPDAERGQIGEVSASAATAIQAAAQKDAADAAKKAAQEAIAAARQQKEAYDNVVRSVTERIAQDKEALDGTGRLTAAESLRVKVLNDIAAGHLKLSPQQSAYVHSLLDAAAAGGKALAIEQQRQAALARTATLEQQLAERIARQSDQNAISALGVGHGAQVTQQWQDELRVRQEYDKQRDAYMKEARKLPAGSEGAVGSDAYNGDLARIAASQQQELVVYRAGVQQRLAAESDWRNGAIAAMEDVRDAGANVAGQTRTFFTSAFDDMTDALATFATTGKLHFKELAASILADLAKMEMRIAASQILQSLIGSMFGGSSGGTYSGSMAGYSSFGSSSGGFNFAAASGGRAGGGPVMPGSMYEVAEGGRPELLMSGGRAYLMTGAQGGQVIPATAGAAGGSAAPVIQQSFAIDNRGNVGEQTSAGQSSALARQFADRMRQVSRDAIVQEMRPGGLLWRMHA